MPFPLDELREGTGGDRPRVGAESARAESNLGGAVGRCPCLRTGGANRRISELNRQKSYQA
jgi:hypothetical protein